MPKIEDQIEIHERLTKIETMLENILEKLEEHKECDLIQDEKLDKIINNDKDKLQRIAKLEEKTGNIKVVLMLMGSAFLGVLAKIIITGVL